MVTEKQVQAAARIISESQLIDAPKLPPEAWMSLARKILNAAKVADMELSEETKAAIQEIEQQMYPQLFTMQRFFDNFENPKFKPGERVRKTRGSSWQGFVVGAYSTSLTREGYAVESEREPGSVQIYPAAALELVPD
tara:strand:+ start:2629 stop:3042 length:414 start_codon:yes stop_codon:yes gene_type:complete